jgi:hypothetical protein
MQLKSFLLSALAVPAVLFSSSCQREIDANLAAAGLQVAKTDSRDTVKFAAPMRMFTGAGEITDAAIIKAYCMKHALGGDSAAYATAGPEHTYSNQSELVFFNDAAAQQDLATKDVVVMRQQDTGALGNAGPEGMIDYMYSAEEAFLALRDQILEMPGSVTKLERVDEQNYCLKECFHVKGTKADGSIRLPYTFMASRAKLGNYPFALKAGVTPRVPAGDTLLVREGYLAIK